MVKSGREILLCWEKDREEGFRLVYERYAGVLLRYTFRFTANQEHAEEILQDLFTEVLQADLSRDFHLKPWLFTIAKHKSLNFLRRGRHEVLSDESLHATLADPGLEEEIYEKQVSQQLQVAGEKLPEDLARTWELRRQGLNYQEISDQLHIPLGTVKSRFSRLVDFFRKEFKLE